MKNHEAEELHSELIGELKDHSNTLIMWQKDIERNQTLRAEIAKLELQLTQLKERLSEVSKGTLMVENLRLKEANAELVKDKERLDWLESQNWTPEAALDLMYSVSIRQAIDAAAAKGTQ
jgi:hypothetical protein